MKFSSLFVQISMYMSSLKKVRMDYSCHGRYKGIHMIYFLVCFHCSVCRISPGQVQNYQLFVSFAGLSQQY